MSQYQPRRTDEGREEDQSSDGAVNVAGGHAAMWTNKITMGEALEATARSAGDRPVQRHDAAAIAAAEATATGMNVVLPGGLADAARLAADANSVATRDEYKTKLGDILGDAVTKIPADKEVTKEDAARVARAEIRTSPDFDKSCGGVADSVTAAARLNEHP
ncbi:Seed maturation protein [Canna indica]|uniref:Seed maturation protein n=1 Tax=Canna indica TaxID=4628 RepID=A0AAQ3QB84_9LILI|nr:Seed maturation protein [Canna indica]